MGLDTENGGDDNGRAVDQSVLDPHRELLVCVVDDPGKQIHGSDAADRILPDFIIQDLDLVRHPAGQAQRFCPGGHSCADQKSDHKNQ